MSATDLIFARYGDLPHMSRGYAERIEAFICEQRIANVLELGFAHGKSSAVIAATLRDLSRGHLVTIDRVQAQDIRPNIDEVLAALDLTAWVTVHYKSKSYTWRLMRMLEDCPYPVFDFCYIDGAHSWDADPPLALVLPVSRLTHGASSLNPALMTTAFSRSTKNAPTSGTTRKALGDAP